MMQLREQSFLARVGVTAFVLVLGAGLLASGAYVRAHHAPRDARAEFSYDDLVGVYHGLNRPSALSGALERGHPEGLAGAERKTLVDWLAGSRVSDDYDNLDLGDFSPAEILDRNCLACHVRGSEDAAAASIPLEFWDDVKAVAYSYEVAPLPTDILLVTTHTHALSLGVLGLVVAGLGLATRFSRGLIGLLVAGSGVGLAVDLAGWWLARESGGLVAAIVAGGALFALCTGLTLALVVLDLWLPQRRRI